MARVRSADGESGGWSLPGGRVRARALATLCVAASAALVLPAAPAEAKPAPSQKQVRAKLDKLNSQVDKLDDALNGVTDKRKAAQKKLQALNKSVAAGKKNYEQMRERVAQLAVSEYKNGGSEIPDLVTSENPGEVLSNMSVVAELNGNRSAAVTQFLNAAQLLQREQTLAKQAAGDLDQKLQTERGQLKQIKKAVAEQQQLLAKLGGGSASSGSGSGHIGGTYTGPARGNARAALNYAYAQLGKPYRFGGTGPGSFDCSGLVMKAEQAAGLSSFPRVVPTQHAATRPVSRSALQPGDLVFFDGDGHVGIYVGGGKFIHAPHTGTVVQIASLSNVWYSSHFNGAGRP